MLIIPREKWILFAHQLIWTDAICIAPQNRKCVDCVLENISAMPPDKT